MAVTEADYSIWDLCYSKGHMPVDFFGGTMLYSNKGTREVPCHFTLIRGGLPGEDRKYLVDCGFKKPEWFGRFPFHDYEDLGTVLGKVGLTPEDIDGIFITHLHFDHVNQMTEFPNATIYLQREEFEGWTMAAKLPERFKPGEHSWIFASLEPDDLAFLNSALAEGRLRLLGGDTVVFPGITAMLARRSHTFGTCCWKIDTQNGPFVISQDAVHWYCNIEDMRPPACCQGDTFNLIFLFDRLRQVVDGDLSRIIPGHDMLIYQKHPSWVVGKNPIAEVNLARGQKSLSPA